MKRSFYYAELDLTVELTDNKDDFLHTCHKNELQLLSIQIHSVISNFLIGRSLYAAPLINKEEKPESQEDYQSFYKDGG